MDAEEGGGSVNDPGGWSYLVFLPRPDGGTTATHAVPPGLEHDVLADIVERYGADFAHVDSSRCRRDAVYHLDLGGMIFDDDPTTDVELPGGRTLRVFRHQGRAVLDLVRSIADASARRIGSSRGPWVKVHGYFHCCVLLIDELPAVHHALSAQAAKFAALEADHAACVRIVLDAANRRESGGEA